MLPIKLPKEEVRLLMAEAEAGNNIKVDFEHQQIVCADSTIYTFEVDQFRKHCLLNGLDEIGLTFEKVDLISAFEERRKIDTPWLEGIGAG